MAAKFDQEMMKKHHFWLLLIPLSIGLLLAWIGLFVNVADATETKAEENKKQKAEIEAAKAQPKMILDLLEAQKAELFKLRTERWQEMWDAQTGVETAADGTTKERNQAKNVFAWPDALDDTLFARWKDAKFGTEIKDPNAHLSFRDQYVKAYDEIDKMAAPLQFANGWQSVLRHVAVFPKDPTSEDIWLALEDFWVQRELIKGLTQVNKDAAQFKRVTNPDPKGPVDLSKPVVFENRTWRLELRVVDRTGGKALAGKIKNLTPRLQPFNATNQLLFKVWLSEDAAKDSTAKPFYFIVEGASMDGGKEEEIKDLKNRHIVYGGIQSIAKIEQVFDARTAPVKRLDRMALGYPSARHAEAELQMTEFSDKEYKAATEGAAGGAGGPPAGGFGGIPMPGAPSGPMSGAASVGGPPPAGVAAGGFGGPAGAASPGESTPNGLARRRYIHKTDQVRAMPVGLGLVVDQAFVQDVLTALANTRLRFQTVQTHLNRFRGNLSYATGSGESPGGFGTPMVGGGGEEGGPPAPRPAGPSGPPRGGLPPVGGPPPSGPTIGTPPGVGGPPPGFSPSIPGGFGGGFFGSSPRSSNEDQVSGHLVEVGIYGILSLYEKFQKEEPKAETPGGFAPPAGAPAMPPTGAPMMPPTGMPPAGPTTMPPTGTPPTGTPAVPGKDAPGAETPPKTETPPKADPPAGPANDLPGKDAPPTGTPPKG